MPGYVWDPIFRAVPQNGPEESIVLREVLTDLLGPQRITLDYEPVLQRREDINRSLRVRRQGYRPRVSIAAMVATMADQHYLSRMMARLQEEGTVNYLSLDGGVVERAVELSRFDGPNAINGKTVVGAEFVIGLDCVDLIDAPPSMMVDPGVGVELVQNGHFDDWSSATDPLSWTETITGGSIAQDTTNQRSGAACLKIVTAAGGVLLDQYGLTGLAPGRRARLGFWTKASAPYAYYSLKVMLWNEPHDKYLDGAGRWVTDPIGDTWVLAANGATSYQFWFLDFRVSTTFGPPDAYYVGVNHDGALGGFNVWVDDLSIKCPVLSAGIATW